ncbi:MAG: polyprenyl synthetase family protein [Chloroflexia bacterium]
MASRSVFEFISSDSESFADAQLWKKLLRYCDRPLWSGECDGVPVSVWESAASPAASGQRRSRVLPSHPTLATEAPPGREGRFVAPICYHQIMNKQLDGRLELDAVTDLVRRALSPEDGKPEEFYAVMRYAMGWTDEQLRPIESGGGKLHRPRLCMLACLAAGGGSSALPAAAALELFHNFTLVHDDIQDDSPQRRHRPSVWSLVGVPLAINTGTACSSRLIGCSLARRDGFGPGARDSRARRVDRAAPRFAKGNMDISFERRDSVSSDEYLAMIERKTGALMGLSCYLGALTAGAPRADLALYRAFGEGVAPPTRCGTT